MSNFNYLQTHHLPAGGQPGAYCCANLVISTVELIPAPVLHIAIDTAHAVAKDQLLSGSVTSAAVFGFV